ncbi:MAG TPA: hybrid sensor histidine kinase/response regulator [bacterium]|nr:hybrid sensor histidine kinase/response regulator [bacterium]HPQ19042.1 hybrid sensor histidine kinase/response regulator [bacterium]
MEEKKFKILVIDDNEDNIFTIKTVLKRENYDVISATRGLAGIELAKKEMPDVIILDIMMPEIDGFEICKMLKADEKTKKIPVMFLSSKFQDIKSKVKGLDLGADDYLIKPFDNLELLARLRVLIRLKTALEEVEQKNRYYLEMLGFISHEIKNPLTSIIGVTETFKSLYKNDISEEQRRLLEIQDKNTEYLKSMIEMYLNLSKIERGEIEIIILPVMLMDDIINPIIERFNYSIEKEKRKIILNTAGFEKQKDLIVKTDKNIIDIVFSNLINNAIKYSLNNSNIEINITKREEDILIEVKNYGEGLTSDDISKLFKRFSRIRTASTKKIKGTGLGLFNSKYLIEKLQGKIWCESEYGKWVKFSFTFPYK